jgi:hypothetical protein
MQLVFPGINSPESWNPRLENLKDESPGIGTSRNKASLKTPGQYPVQTFGVEVITIEELFSVQQTRH